MKLVKKLNKLLDSNLILHNKKSLKTKLDEYDKIISQAPYVEEEGTNITLNNTIEAPFLNLEVEGEQDDYVVISNKNMFNVDKAVTRFENYTGTKLNDWGNYEDGIVTINRSYGAHGMCAFAGEKPLLEKREDLYIKRRCFFKWYSR